MLGLDWPPCKALASRASKPQQEFRELAEGIFAGPELGDDIARHTHNTRRINAGNPISGVSFNVWLKQEGDQ